MSSFHPSSSSSSAFPLPPPPPPLQPLLPSSSNNNPTPGGMINLSTPKTMLKPKRHSTNSSAQGSPAVSTGGWFFRASSAGSPHARAGIGAGVGGAGLKRGPSTRTTGSARSGRSARESADGDGRSKSRTRSRSRARGSAAGGGDADDAGFFESGAGRGNWNGSKTQLEFQLRGAAIGERDRERGRGGGVGSATATPSKLIKRKSLGFVKLGMGFGGGESSSALASGGGGGGGGQGKARYEGIGLGRVVGGTGGGQADGGGGIQQEDVEAAADVPERSRRKSFSRLLRDRSTGGTDNLRAPSATSTPQPSSPFIFVDNTPGSSHPTAPATPTPHSNLKEKEKEGSRGFISSMRRLSLVGMGAGGRHKRSKSGGTTLDGGGGGVAAGRETPARDRDATGAAGAEVFGGKENRKTGAARGGAAGNGNGNGNMNVPYSLPPLPASATASASQLSLRLPSNSTSNSLGMGAGRRMVSSSSQSQTQSRRSSVLPASSTSASSSVAVSRAPSLSRERERVVPGSAGRSTAGGGGIARRGRASEEGPRKSPIGVAAGGGGGVAGRSRSSLDFDFGAQILQAGVRERERLEKEKEKEKAKQDDPDATSSNSKPNTPAPMLLPPIELQPPSPPRTVTSATSSSNTTATTPLPAHRSRTSIDMQMFEHPSTSLGSAFSLNPPSATGPIASQSTGALSPTTSTSSIFFTPNSSPNKSAGAGGNQNKLAVRYSPGRSPQSASLGRATAASGVGGDGGGGSAGVGAGGAGGVSGSGSVAPPRRNSLGDLKIPARISQAQVGLRRDLGMVREFATNIEQLKELMDKYNNLVTEVQTILDAHAQRHAQLALPAAAPPQPLPAPAQRATSPSFFANLSAKAKTRGRSNTNPSSAPPMTLQAQAVAPPDVTTSQFAYKDMASAFYTINSRYRISWECAELLIELGGGGPASADVAGSAGESASAASPPPTSASAPMMQQAQGAGAYDANATPNGKRGRERAITLAGDEGKSSVPAPLPPASTHAATSSNPSTSGPQQQQPLASPPPNNNTSSWRASTGRHDLSHRQLVLLREMLNNSNATAAVDAEDSHLSIPEDAIPPALQSLQALNVHVNRDWRWGDARNSTITLPSEESTGYRYSVAQGEGGSRRASTDKDRDKKRGGGRMGMTGIRDMLRALRRSHIEGVDPVVGQAAVGQRAAPSAYHSTTSLSTQSSAGSRSRHRYPHPRVPSQLRRRGKSSTGPESVRSTTTTTRQRSVEQHPYSATPPFNSAKPSPRRPSLASIFRIGNRTRPPSVAVPDASATDAEVSTDADGYDGYAPTPTSGGTATGGEDSSSSTGEEDWDRMDSASDLDAAARALGVDGAATVRGMSSENRRRAGVAVKGKSPYMQRDSYPPPPLPHPLPSAASSAGYSQGQSQSQLNLHSVLPKRSFTASQSSLWTSEQYQQQQQQHQGSPHATSHMPTSRTTRLSNVEEHSDDPVAHPRVASHPITSPHPGSSRSHNNGQPNLKTGSLRSMPPHLLAATTTMPLSSDASRLAMTPENIKPLLENAKEVHARLAECIDEIQSLLERTTLGS